MPWLRGRADRSWLCCRVRLDQKPGESQPDPNRRANQPDPKELPRIGEQCQRSQHNGNMQGDLGKLEAMMLVPCQLSDRSIGPGFLENLGVLRLILGILRREFGALHREQRALCFVGGLWKKSKKTTFGKYHFSSPCFR